MDPDRIKDDLPIWMFKRETGFKRVICKTCHGNGLINVIHDSHPGYTGPEVMTCTSCGGVGMVNKKKIVLYERIFLC